MNIHYEGAERVYPCRCGETHRGDYAAYDYAHHNCFHDADLIVIDRSIPGYLMCPDCGETFNVATPKGPRVIFPRGSANWYVSLEETARAAFSRVFRREQNS